MKILYAEVTNFGSYRHLRFRFDGLGLALVSGQTGSGKSTLLDIVPWILFSTTSKNGAVSDVQAWQADGEPTTGKLTFQFQGRTYQIIRIRGRNGENDLYWRECEDRYSHIIGTDAKFRGKDLNDTQKCIEARLGVNSDTYLSSTYFHEFSQTGTFFTSNAKARRELFDRVCDLSFPVKLSASCSDLRKQSRNSYDVLQLESSELRGQLKQLERSVNDSRSAGERWNTVQAQKIKALEAKAATFEDDKAKTVKDLLKLSDQLDSQTLTEVSHLEERIVQQESKLLQIKALDEKASYIRRFQSTCEHCGSVPKAVQDELDTLVNQKAEWEQDVKQAKVNKFLLQKVKGAVNPYTWQLAQAEAQENAYTTQAEAEKAAVNPFLAQVASAEARLDQVKDRVAETDAASALELTRTAALTRLIDLTSTLRGELLSRSVREIETATNASLEKHFDAEIRVAFTLADADSLDIEIFKSGYSCNYKQLSRGQRALLRLNFSVAVMKATANAAGFHPSMIALDEVTDAFDESLKLRAFSFLEQLATEYDTVLVIDHSTALKSMFTSCYEVRLEGDCSVIEASQ